MKNWPDEEKAGRVREEKIKKEEEAEEPQPTSEHTRWERKNNERWASEKDDKSKKQFTRVNYKSRGWAGENGKSLFQEGSLFIRTPDVRFIINKNKKNH